MRIPVNRAFRGGQHRRDSGRARKRFLVPVFALGLMASLVQVFMTSAPASASVQDYHPATYNMQGGGTSRGVSKWTSDIPQILRNGYNVIALQEAGSGPPGSARYLHTYMMLGRTSRHMGWNVDVYDWRPGGQNHDWRIYFMRTQTGGNRVNFAMLTDRYVTGVNVAPPSASFYNANGQPTARPALGLTMGDTQFWNVHALSGNGNDGQGLIENIAATAQWRHWAAMGDWNRIPARQNVGPGRYLYTSGEATQHSANNELDYMVSNEYIAGYGGWTRGYGSDHMAVMFHRLMANADVQLINISDHAQYMGSVNAYNGTSIVSSGYPDLSHWRFIYRGGDTYNIVNARSSKCMSDYAGHLIEWDCNGAGDQLFSVYSWADMPGHISLRPSNRRSKCVGDDGRDGWGTDILTTVDCRSGKTRIKVRGDYDPGPDAAPVII